ncbi:MAG: biosynthetic peptidoglycan transglycosylase, partial [Bacillota bacterium]|nr:biosynthetic peptidoglycan transglycosylase [Bacillota bacterium]
MMKTLSGYILILLLLPVFILCAFQTVDEARQVKSLNEILDKKIKIQDVNLPQKSAIVDHNGALISNIPGSESRLYLESRNIPPFLKNIFIVSEDRHFYTHPGFDLYAIGRAMAVNLKSHGISQGASTITQQLARNVFLSQQRTYNRKLSEVLYAYQLERSFSKKKILELYLNAIYFQNGAYGIEAAAQKYFNKHIQQLTKGEQAFLAAIPNNPTLYDPLKHFNFTKARQVRLIDQLRASG